MEEKINVLRKIVAETCSCDCYKPIMDVKVNENGVIWNVVLLDEIVTLENKEYEVILLQKEYYKDGFDDFVLDYTEELSFDVIPL